MKKLFENKPRAWFVVGSILVALITITSIGLGFYLNDDSLDKGVLAKVGEENITQDDLNEALYGISFNEDATYTETDRDNRLNQLIEFSIANQEASKLGVSVADKEIDDYIKKNVPAYNTYTEAQKAQTRQTVKDSLTLEKVKVAAIGWREANYLVVNFHKYFETNNKDYQVEGMGDETLIQKNKTNALAYATDLSNRLKNKELTYEQAKKELYAHSEFGVDALLPRTPDMGGQIKKEYFIEGLLDQNLQDALLTLKQNEVSDPVVDTGKASETGGEELEYRYIVYQVTATGNSEYSTYEKWFAAMKEKYGVTSTSILSFISTEAHAASAASCANTCSLDNAELYITMQYYTADGYAYNSLTTGSFDVQGGTPWATNDGSNCDSPARSAGIEGTPKPTWSSCDTAGKSFYCASDSVMYLVLHPDVAIPGTDPALGVWTWDEQTAANTYSAWPTGQYTPGSRWRDNYNGSTHTWGTDWSDLSSPGGAIALLNLRAGRNAENEQMNGKLLWEVFRWHPKWLSNYTLTVVKNGTGSGTVTSADGKINYGSDNTESYLQGSTVALTATAAANSAFAGWSGGGCSGTGGCNVTMDAAKTVTATFNNTLPPALSCSVSPNSGPVPLVVVVDGVATNFAPTSYGYRFQRIRDTEGTAVTEAAESILGRGAQVYYTLPSAGVYNVWISAPNYQSGAWVSCTPTEVTVNSLSDPDGGEVAP